MRQCCGAIERHFDRARVESELAAYRRDGPGKTTRLLIELLAGAGVRGLRLLDVGAGLGALGAGLFPHGLRSSVQIDASEAYGAAAADLAAQRGHADRVELHSGDFVSMATGMAVADIVTLDRVICCYDDMPALVDASVSKAERLYALSVPRNAWPVRRFIGVENLLRRLRGNPFRTFVHPTDEIDRRVRQQGFEIAGEARALLWWVAVYRRVVSR
ncbi:MAG: hypothetical protein ACRELC_01610 [Gemmatimonadota bacterium]